VAVGRRIYGPERDTVGVNDRGAFEAMFAPSIGFLPTLSAHVLVAEDEDCHAERRELEHLLEERFDVHHTALQVDHATPGVIPLDTPHVRSATHPGDRGW
jgi:hypothetical protein